MLISGSGAVMIAGLFKFLPAVAVLVPPLGLAFLLAYFIAWRRAWKQGRVEARLRRSGARNPLWRLGLALLLTLIWPLFIAASSISKFGNATAIAKSMRVQADVQAIKTQLQLYESMNGFFPTTERVCRRWWPSRKTIPDPLVGISCLRNCQRIRGAAITSTAILV